MFYLQVWNSPTQEKTGITWDWLPPSWRFSWKRDERIGETRWGNLWDCKFWVRDMHNWPTRSRTQNKGSCRLVVINVPPSDPVFIVKQSLFEISAVPLQTAHQSIDEKTTTKNPNKNKTKNMNNNNNKTNKQPNNNNSQSINQGYLYS